MKKRGFTLIELLAVIIVLAIIALIAVPIVINIIEDARKGAAKVSARNYVATVENAVELGNISENYSLILDGTYTVLELKNMGIILKGDMPTDGSKIEIVNGIVTSCELMINGYSCICGNNDMNVIKLESEKPSARVEVVEKNATITLEDNESVVGYSITSDTNTPTTWTNIVRAQSITFTYEAETAGTYYVHVIDYSGNTSYKKFEIDKTAFCMYKEGEGATFSYTGDSQKFTVPCSGTYKVELWGASGASDTANGAYTSGEIYLNKDVDLYVYVGGVSNDVVAGSGLTTPTTFNGGGSGGAGGNINTAYYSAKAGGGATDIRYFGSTTPTAADLVWSSTLGLNSRIMVAAGAGGNSADGYAAAGGGLTSLGYVKGDTRANISASSQTSGYSFGIGQNGASTGGGRYCNGHGGGGGGYFGGSGGPGGYGMNCYTDTGSGGTSYISGHTGCVAIESETSRSARTGNIGFACQTGLADKTCSIHYSNYKFINTVMIDGEGHSWTTVRNSTVTKMPTHDGTSTMIGNTGNGYAKITYLGPDEVEEKSDELVLYDSGTIENDISGGFENAINGSAATFEPNYISLFSGYSNTNNRAVSIVTKNPIDITEYTKLNIIGEFTCQNCQFNYGGMGYSLSTTKNTTGYPTFTPYGISSTTSRNLATLDISSYSGNYYVYLFNHYSGLTKIYRVWLSK